MTTLIIDNTHAEVRDALTPVDHDGNQMIDARALHGWLEVEARYNDWFRRRVKEYGFAAGEDFYSSVSKTKGRSRADHLLTIDMAKELSMIERTERGRAARRYFIAMEKAAVQMAADHVANGTPEAIPQGFFDAAAAFAGLRDEYEARFAALEAKLLPPALPDLPDWLTARGAVDAAGLVDPRVPAGAAVEVVKRVGQELTSFCILNGFEVQKRGGGPVQERNAYPREAVVKWMNRDQMANPNGSTSRRFHGCR
jgi:anti-repressor protein